jgi:hypothetical protein
MSPVVFLSPTSRKKAMARGDPLPPGTEMATRGTGMESPFARDAAVAGVGYRGSGRLEGTGRLEDEVVFQIISYFLIIISFLWVISVLFV